MSAPNNKDPDENPPQASAPSTGARGKSHRSRHAGPGSYTTPQGAPQEIGAGS
ncbi:MAG: hypothetical protein JWN73_4544 [Betaproteobacteria bacterium]|nr:hypothetical protein [Betaproteobacteria bacterium]